MRLPRAIGIASFLLVSAYAQTIPPSLFQDLDWRLIGPFRGGRAIAVTGAAGNPGLFYFGAVGGGIWKSTDAGTVWKPVFDDQKVASIGALEVAPSNPQILYAGTGEADIRSDIAFGNGVYRSDDGGAHWRNIGLRGTFQIGRIIVHPTNPDVVYVAALGHAYAANSDRGVYRTRNGGQTWEKVLDKGPDIGAVDLAMDPDHPDVLYATAWHARRTPWSQYPPNEGPGSGIYRSTDGGASWNPVLGNGLPGGDWGRVGVAMARGTDTRRVYALISAKEGGLFRSDDGGVKWERVSSDRRIDGRAWYFSFLAVDPKNPDTVYIPNTGMYRSVDGGRNFTVVRAAPGGDDYHSIWIDPTDSARMILGSDQGVSISMNGGVTWTTWYNQPTAQLYHVITDNQFPYNVCACQQDSGALCIPSRTDHFSINERDFVSIGGNEAGWVAPDPKDANILYLTDTYGSVSRFDKRTAQDQIVTPWPMPSFGSTISGRKFRAPWTTPLLFSPVDPTALYLGAQYLLKSSDGGLSWKTISPDLTGDLRAAGGSAPNCAGPATMSSAKACGYGVVYSIAPSPLEASEIWTGSDTGLIYLTRDGGANWTNVTPPDVEPWSKITHIEASHFDPAEAWAAIDRHRLDDYDPYILRTRDFGKTWKRINGGIDHGAFVNAVREDPKRQGLLFAATETGVWTSFNDGDNWQPLEFHLPTVSVRDLVVHGDDLVIATHGRSMWVLDNITPLRQASQKVTQASAYLYEPAEATRMLHASFLGTPLPPEIPAGKNPPEGATVDYWLASASTDAVKLEILDGGGKVIRRYSSADAVPPPPKNLSIADIWVETPQRLSAAAGHHRFVWDLRYAGPAAGEDDEESEFGPSVGPLVIPGAYTLRLTAAGQTLTRTLHVVQDPRSPMTQKDLEQQRDVALQIVSEMRKLDEMAKRDPKLKAQLGRIQVGFSSALATVTSADRVPPVQALEVFEQSRAELAKLQTAQ